MQTAIARDVRTNMTRAENAAYRQSGACEKLYY